MDEEFAFLTGLDIHLRKNLEGDPLGSSMALHQRALLDRLVTDGVHVQLGKLPGYSPMNYYFSDAMKHPQLVPSQPGTVAIAIDLQILQTQAEGIAEALGEANM